MSVNKIKILSSTVDKQLNIPIEIKWDYYGQEDSIDIWEEDVLEKVVGTPKDFELARFYNKEYPNSIETNVIYNFNFYSGAPESYETANQTKWGTTYNAQGFQNKEIYYLRPGFSKSFFKLDFYDTNDTATQKNYFTIILPANQSQDFDAFISEYLPPVKISYPKYILDFINQKEGYFLYWLSSREYIDIDTFYMSAKFFNGATGQFIKMMNKCQGSSLLSNNRFQFDPKKYFYYKVKLNYSNFTYEIFDYTSGSDVRVGNQSSPINWFQYLNP